jgi:hypothetical protein
MDTRTFQKSQPSLALVPPILNLSFVGGPVKIIDWECETPCELPTNKVLLDSTPFTVSDIVTVA